MTMEKSHYLKEEDVLRYLNYSSSEDEKQNRVFIKLRRCQFKFQHKLPMWSKTPKPSTAQLYK